MESKAKAGHDLPVHFFTIVLNGEPFVRYHLDAFRRLAFPWHWHVVEGVASLVGDTAWSKRAGGRIDPESHVQGLSTDGTSAYLDEIDAAESERVTIYRKPAGSLWAGKREMVSAPLRNIREECLLWEVDADELWTAEQITAVRQRFIEEPGRTSAYYWSHHVAAPNAVIATRYNYAADPEFDTLRTWRYRPGDGWHTHEPPCLIRPRPLWRGGPINLGDERPFLQDEMEDIGAVFQHFAYATEAQVRFKESYYGYDAAVERWRTLGEAVRVSRGPLRLGDYLPWVSDQTLVDDARRRNVALLASERDDGSWFFTSGTEAPNRTAGASGSGAIVVDGVFFQHLSEGGIARVWRSYFREWVKTGFAERVVFLDRGGAGPRLPGLPTRSLPPWRAELTAQDSLRLQRVCDEEGAALFVSTYYTTPISTPSLMLVYDLIPERVGMDRSEPVWNEKRLAIEHASSYVCISENTCRDLLELEPAARGKQADVVLLGVDEHFDVPSPREVAAFRHDRQFDRPYFLLVGDRHGVGGYKNARLVFNALRDWPGSRTHELVCVGGGDVIEPELRAVASRARVRRVALNDQELRLCYGGAVALVFPSRYEGFGLPVIEAMACGCPVITTPVSSLPEVAGDAALYVDPDDPRSLQEAFELVREPDRRAALIAEGLKRAEAFTWARSASMFASRLSAAAMAEKLEERAERERVWKSRRRAQSEVQLPPATNRRQPGVHRKHDGATGLRGLALRHLPSWAISVLRAIHYRLSVLRSQSFHG